MSYSLQFQENEKFVELVFTDPISLAEITRARKEADAVCVNHCCKHVLLDMAAINTNHGLKFLDFYEFGKNWQKEIEAKSATYAAVLPEDPKSRKDISFSITVALNRGVSVKGFHQRKDAVGWLNRQD